MKHRFKVIQDEGYDSAWIKFFCVNCRMVLWTYRYLWQANHGFIVRRHKYATVCKARHHIQPSEADG